MELAIKGWFGYDISDKTVCRLGKFNVSMCISECARAHDNNKPQSKTNKNTVQLHYKRSTVEIVEFQVNAKNFDIEPKQIGERGRECVHEKNGR